MIERITKYLPLLYIILTAIGLLKQTIYYRIFNINIIEYIQITEVLTLLTNDIILYTLIFFTCVVTIFLLSKTDSFDEYHLIKVYNMPFWRRHIAFSNKLSWAMFLTTIMGALSLIVTGQYQKLTGIVAFTIASFFSFIYLVITLEICRAFFNYSQKPNTNIAISIQILSTFIFILVTVVTKSGLDIRFRTNKPNIELYTENLGNSVDKNHVYIGKTDKYIFVYNYKSHETEVYTTDFIKKIVILN